MQGDGGFEPESMALELQDSLSTENSEDDGSSSNRAYVPCGVGATVKVLACGKIRGE